MTELESVMANSGPKKGTVPFFLLAAIWAGAVAAGEVPPGASAYPPQLERRLGDALAALGPGHDARTAHVRADGTPRYTNRLILEDSPYLRQHAHNPVDWYSWDAEALDKAAREGKPVFLSIGYSSCHWCHVMERESFDDLQIAALLNESFVSIKVDRERRPDVDHVYMTALQLMVGHGGWPMSGFLTPEGKPFFGGTYFPKEVFAQLLDRGAQLWRTQPERLREVAERITVAVLRVTATHGRATSIDRDVIARAVDEIVAEFDPLAGGFGAPAGPKFAREPALLLLLDFVSRWGHEPALDAVLATLRAMARGGIYDHVGGGFHRYSTDGQWRVPHFEKMLHNQAYLARIYATAYQLTGEPTYARVAAHTLDYVLRDMTSAQGAFYSATDADSEGAEGTFFVWTPAQLRASLG